MFIPYVQTIRYTAFLQFFKHMKERFGTLKIIFKLNSRMNRINSPFSLLAVFFVASLSMSGCKAPTVPYQISQFSTLRIMNFAPFYGSNCSPTAPMDAFWYPVGQARQTQASAYNILYGDASVYTNLIQSGNYNILVTPHLIPTTTDVQTTVTLAPNQKYSLVITRAQSGQFNSEFIQDGVSNPAQNLAYVRFMNLQPATGSLTVRVNDPVSGDIINPISDSFGQVSTYVPLQTAMDTSYTFFLTNSSNQIITRLGYQTFTGGNCYTLVYAGDPCQTLAKNNGDSTISSVDTLRLRAFDDNSGGNDLTNPIVPSFRFNIVNDIIPLSPYDQNNPSDSTIGFLVNAEGFQEFNNYTIPAVHVYQGGGVNTAAMVNGAYEVNYQSLQVPNPMNVQGFVPSTSLQLFYAKSLSESALVGATAAANYNKPFTFLFYDTVSAKDTALSSQLASSSHYALLPVPDTSDPNSVIIEFISGIVQEGQNKSTANYSLFYVTPTGGSVVQAPSNASKGRATGNSQILSIPLAAGTSSVFGVTDSIGEGGSGANVRVFGNTSSFTAQAGGIYEIVSMGTKVDPHLLIMQVNGNTP
jgi:Domain of unknown function (DUF4397)